VEVLLRSGDRKEQWAAARVLGEVVFGNAEAAAALAKPKVRCSCLSRARTAPLLWRRHHSASMHVPRV
jgi:hypothetical protein